MAYFQINPFGQDHNDFLLAQLTALVCNIGARDKTEATDWLPFHRKKEQTPEEMEAVLRGILG